MAVNSGPIYQIHRGFDTSSESLFDAWTTPATMQRWMFVIPANEIQEVTIDKRVGGRYSILECNDGEVMDHFGEYQVLERPSLLVFTLAVPKHFPGTTLVRVAVAPTDRGCEMTFTQTGVAREIVEDSWQTMFETLTTVLRE